MDLRQFEVFLAVMEHGTVTRAAESLHVSPGAVSLQLKGLAEELRTPLFVRDGKRIAPTPQAFRLAEHARDVVLRIGAIRRDFANESEVDSRPFHFACGATHSSTAWEDRCADSARNFLMPTSMSRSGPPRKSSRV